MVSLAWAPREVADRASPAGGRGYFGRLAVARAETGRRVMALRGRLIGAALLEDLSGLEARSAIGR